MAPTYPESMKGVEMGRAFLKAAGWEAWTRMESDQKKRLPHPPQQKPCPARAILVDLEAPTGGSIGAMPLYEVIARRRSRRRFSDEPLTRAELSFLLWATHGVHEVIRDGAATLRSVPSGGARHPFETYLAVRRVEGLAPGLYRYLPLDHKLHFIAAETELAARAAEACRGQEFVAEGAVVFAWTAVPYRAEWRYGSIAHKVIAIDAGHLCQNLYLASESMGAGTCAIAAYDQEKMDRLLGVDGREEFTIYVAVVGKVHDS